MDYWTVNQAADAWGVTPDRVRKLAARVPGARRELEGCRLIWLIPAGAKNPARASAGRPKQSEK